MMAIDVTIDNNKNVTCSAWNSPSGKIPMPFDSDDDDIIYSAAENLVYLSTSTTLSNPKPNHLSKSRSALKITATPDRTCQLCSTKTTPLWRRNEKYHTLCNACGIRERTVRVKSNYRARSEPQTQPHSGENLT